MQGSFLWCTLAEPIVRAAAEEYHQAGEIDGSEETEEPVEAAKTLLALAMTCKDFGELALRELWSRQVNLNNFIRLLPISQLLPWVEEYRLFPRKTCHLAP